MKYVSQRWLGLLILFLCVRCFGQPPVPSDPLLVTLEFSTNFDTGYDFPPLAFTNVASDPVWIGNALVLETSNATPAYLQYRMVETNGNTNIDLSTGTIFFTFAPDWASADDVQYGTGPGSAAFFVSAGDWRVNSPNGFFCLYADAAGTNINLAGINSSGVTIYVSAPISWASNVWHVVDCEYSPSNSFLYLDGQLAASGSGVTIVPSTNACTNAFFVGSDASGHEQARGAFWFMMNWDIEEGSFINNTNEYADFLNEIATWEGGGGSFSMFSGFGGGSLTGGGSGSDIVGPAVYITNMTATLASGPSMNFTFTIDGGTNGLEYDVFSTTNLVAGDITNSVWTWLGQGTNSGTYQATNQSMAQSTYVLGTPQLASDGSGFTTAYEALVIQANPFSADSGSPTIPIGWAYSLGLIPNVNYLGNTSLRINYTYDPVGRLDLVTGVRAETLTNDFEGNVLLAH